MAKIISNPTQVSVRVKPAIPAWAANTSSGTWTEVPMAATLASIDPAKSSLYNPNYPRSPEWNGSTGQWSIVGAWCGAAYDEDTDTMWLGVGGGHSNYGGNEIYRCGFFDARPAWTMVRPPSGAVGNLLTTHDGRESTGLYADGRPRAVHGYNKWVYVPGVGPALAVHGSTAYSANGGKAWSVFINPTNGEASFSVEHTGTQWGTTDSGACYDPRRHAIWIAPADSSSIYYYEIPRSGGAHTGAAARRLGATDNEGSRACTSVTYIPDDDVLLVAASNGRRWRVFDCKTPRGYSPPFDGTPTMSGMGMTQPRWVPSLGAVCAWHNNDNRAVITTITPGANPRTDAWTFGTLPKDANTVTPRPQAVTPSAPASNGTYGRFAYSPRLGGFLVFNSIDGPTYFYKI